jgi:hypothetical protein
MRFGYWRGVTLALGLGCLLANGLVSTASAQGLFHTIPPVAPAYDVHTGGPFNAPPVPYGCYAKDLGGGFHKAIGGMKGKLSMLHGGACGDCGGAGCGKCKHGGLLHHGRADDCDSCGDPGCGMCKGGGLFAGHGRSCGNCGGMGCGLCAASPQCGAPVVKTMPSAQACGTCGGKGCGLCKGSGLFAGHGSACGDPGCGLCKGGLFHGGGCHRCGGAGCDDCKGHGKHDLCLKFTSLLHHGNRIQYFVGAGGPVPLTPGYVPYVVPVRSPRDYFAFPPFTPDAP